METYTLYVAMAFLPWSFTPVFGVRSDHHAIKGHHKLWYARIAAFLLPFFILGIVFAQTAKSSLLFIICVSTVLAMLKTVYDGQYAIQIRMDGASKSIAAFVQVLVTIGVLVGTIIVGAVANNKHETGNIRWAFAAAIPLVLPMWWYLVKYPNSVFSYDKEMVATELETPLSRDMRPDESHQIRMRLKPTEDETILAIGMGFAGCFMLLFLYLAHTGTHVIFEFVAALVVTGTVVGYAAWTYRKTPELAGVCTFAVLYEFL